jgi:hypothetical protein
MAHGKSLELRYNAPTKTDETITEDGRGRPSSAFSPPVTFRNPKRAERKAKQLLARRGAKWRAQVNGKRDGR